MSASTIGAPHGGVCTLDAACAADSPAIDHAPIRKLDALPISRRPSSFAPAALRHLIRPNV